MLPTQPGASSRPGVPPARATPRTLYLVIVLDLIGFATLMPLLASYGARLGASSAEIGFLVASYSLMHVGLAAAWGRWSDRIGRRPVLLIGLAGSLAGAVVFAVADTFALLVLSRLLAGGIGTTTNVAQAYLADVTPPDRRTRAMGLLGAAYGIGFIIGPILGGIASSISDPAPGIVASVLALGNLLYALRALREPVEHQPRPVTATEPVPRRHLRILGAGMAATAAFTVMYVVFPLFGEERLGFDRSQVSYLFAWVGTVNAVAQGGLAGRLSRRFGDIGTSRLGALIMAGGFLVLPFTAGIEGTLGFGVFLAALFCVALGFGTVLPALTGRLSALAGPSQGEVLGRLHGANSLARAIGPMVAGVMYGLGGAGLAFALSGGMAIAAVLLANGSRKLEVRS